MHIAQLTRAILLKLSVNVGVVISHTNWSQCVHRSNTKSMACVASGSGYARLLFDGRAAILPARQSSRAKNDFNLTPPHSSRGTRGFSPTKHSRSVPAPASYAGYEIQSTLHLSDCSAICISCESHIVAWPKSRAFGRFLVHVIEQCSEILKNGESSSKWTYQSRVILTTAVSRKVR